MRYRGLLRQKLFASEFRAPETAPDCSAIVNLHLKCLGLSDIRIYTKRNQKMCTRFLSASLLATYMLVCPHRGSCGAPTGVCSSVGWRGSSDSRAVPIHLALRLCIITFCASLFLFLVISFRQLDIPFSRRLTHILSLSLVLLMCAEHRRRQRAVLQLLHDSFFSPPKCYLHCEMLLSRAHCSNNHI